MEKAETVPELAAHFNMKPETIKQELRKKGSPGFKAGSGKTSAWLCFPAKFEIFLLKNAELYKGQ